MMLDVSTMMRTQVELEAKRDQISHTFLQRIVNFRARFAVLNLTGVEIVKTLVANNLIKIVNAIHLLGAEGLVSGLDGSSLIHFEIVRIEQPRIEVCHLALAMVLSYWHSFSFGQFQ